jgi:hypothetical protein
MKADLLKFVTDQIERYTKEHDKLAAILGELPDLDYKSVSTCAYRADFRASFEVETAEDVRSLLGILVPDVELVLYRDGCSSFIPEERLTDKERADDDADKATPACPVTVRCSHLGHPGQRQYEWYHCLPSGKLLSVHVCVRQSYRWASWSGHRRMHHGNIHIENEVFCHHFTGARRIRWATGGTQYFHDVTLYWDRDTALDTLFQRDDARHEVR